jgi:hypothetical protein
LFQTRLKQPYSYTFVFWWPEPLYLSARCWGVSGQLLWVYGQRHIRWRLYDPATIAKITPTSARLTIALRNSNGYVDAYASNDQIFDGSIASDDDKVTLPGYKYARQNTEFGPVGMCHYWMYHFVRALCLDAVGWRTGLSDSRRKSLKALCVVAALL